MKPEVEQILKDLHEINPYKKQATPDQYWCYTVGWMSAWLAETLKQEPQLRQQWRRSVQRGIERGRRR